MIEKPELGEIDSNRSVPRTPAGAILALLIFPTLGASLAYALLVTVVLPRVGYGSVQRIVSVGEHLRHPYTSPTVVCLGNSVTIEGVDAGIVAGALGGGQTVENLAIAGCHTEELRVLAPAVAQARPAAVVVTLLPSSVAKAGDVELDKAYAYNLGGFHAVRPAGRACSNLPGLSAKVCRALAAPRWRVKLHFRTAPILAMNRAVRVLLNPSVQTRPPDEWRTPFVRTGSIHGLRLERHVREMRETWAAMRENGNTFGPSEVTALINDFADAGVPILAVVSPVHPAFHDGFADWAAELRTLLDRLAERPGVFSADASDLVGEDGYSDALHLNEQGRARFSRFLGEHLVTMMRSGTTE